jgi:hypothetical protein
MPEEQDSTPRTVWHPETARRTRQGMEIGLLGLHCQATEVQGTSHQNMVRLHPGRSVQSHKIRILPPMLGRSHSRRYCVHLHEIHSRQPWIAGRSHIGQRQALHVTLLDFPNGTTRSQTKAINRLPSLDRRTDREDELDARTILALLYRLPARQLGRAAAAGTVRIQQCNLRSNWILPVLPELWIPTGCLQGTIHNRPPFGTSGSKSSGTQEPPARP